ncbi:MAG: Glu/Leu/Phe/Val family dehydrogenase [Planctomycetota bacterium]
MITQRTFGSDFDDAGAAAPSADENAFVTMMASFDAAAQRLGLDPSLYAILRKPDREIHVSVPTPLDRGGLAIFDGYRVQHNTGMGPYFGPLRFGASLTLDELRAVAGWMTWKCSLLDIPFGGSAGGIRLDVGKISGTELERAVRRYVSVLVSDLGQDHDVFASERITDSRVMAWVMDTMSMHSRFTENAVVCGKPLALGGTLGHHDAVAQGVRTLLPSALERAGLPPAGAKIVIQGAGTRGANLLRLLSPEHTIVGFSDVHGAMYDEGGLDCAAILAWLGERKRLEDFTGDFDSISNEQMFARPCDVFIPCAVDTVVRKNNAPTIQAKLILEAANGPISANADRILAERGITVVPDILATGGGPIVNYFEWVQNRAGYSWPLERVQKRMARMLTAAWSEVVATAEAEEVTLRTAAHMVAVRNVAGAARLRGLYA